MPCGGVKDGTDHAATAGSKGFSSAIALYRFSRGEDGTLQPMIKRGVGSEGHNVDSTGGDHSSTALPNKEAPMGRHCGRKRILDGARRKVLRLRQERM